MARARQSPSRTVTTHAAPASKRAGVVRAATPSAATGGAAASASLSVRGDGNGGGGADDAGTATDFDAEYDALINLKLSNKENKYDFKAQIAVAKDFTTRAKSLMRDMRGALCDNAGAVQAAYEESAAEVHASQAGETNVSGVFPKRITRDTRDALVFFIFSNADMFFVFTSSAK